MYGLSARGLAIDTALESGEEFPYFKEFWLQRPTIESTEIIVYALLDSPSLTGAYRFTIIAGEQTEMNVQLRLFFRKVPEKLGIAPLTSMFFYSENTNVRPIDDFRPEIHDSDGLFMSDSVGKTIWRPLVNLKHLFINSFKAINPTGFGLQQRDLDFDHYQDNEARYDKRPSLLVTPDKRWGPGKVELVQIPTDKETNDNTVAYWVPSERFEKEEPVDFSYRLNWYQHAENVDGLGQIIATRTASGGEDDIRRLIVDFKGGQLNQLPASLPIDSPLSAVAETSKNGEIVEQQLYYIQPLNSWRLVLHVRRKAETSILDSISLPLESPEPVEVWAHLQHKQSVLTEKVSYALWP